MRVFITLFIILLMAACSKEPMTYDFDLQGHRGARGLLPENTIPSFKKAVDYRVDTVEFDVVVTADRRILVSHEPWFNHKISTAPDGLPVRRRQAQGHNIFQMTYEETRRYDVGRRGNPDFPMQEPIPAIKPLMIDAILAVEQYAADQGLDPVRYSIETKSDTSWYNSMVPEPEEFAQLLYDELTSEPFEGLDLLDRVIVQSFDPATLIALRELDPDIAQAMLISERRDRGSLFDRYLDTLGYTPEIWSPRYQIVSREMVEEAHRRGMKVIPWTVNRSKDMRSLLEMGVDGLITDYPNRAQQFRPGIRIPG